MLNTLVFDIETLAEEPCGPALEEKIQKLKEEYAKDSTIAEKLEKWKAEQAPFDAEWARPIAFAVINLTTGKEWSFCSEDSKEVAAHFWVEVGSHPQVKLVGFNCKAFDLPIMVRWGLAANCQLLRKFGRYDVVDLIKEPFGWDMKGKSLAWYGRTFDCGIKSGHGSEVAGLWAAGKHEEIKEYCLQDTRITAKLYQKFSKFFTL